MAARSIPRLPTAATPAEAVVDAALVLGKAVNRAALALGVSQSQLAAIVGASPATISRIVNGTRGLDPASKEGELALLFVRIFRSLDALVGGDAAKARAWLEAENAAFGTSPLALLPKVEGLVDVAIYLDAMRGRL